jgi:predicted nucleic acid-binding protein
MRWVVDASVAAKWLVPEPESAAADTLLDAELLAPDLLYAEVANILWKKQTRGEVEPAVVNAGVRWLLQVPLQVHDGAALFADAVSLSQRLQHPAYDCFYLALAQSAEAPLVTADRRLFERCQRTDATEWGDRVRLLTAGGAVAPH